MSGGSSGGGMSMQPQDNSLQIAQMNLQKQREDEAARAAKAEEDRKTFYTNRDSAVHNAISSAGNIISSRGLDPNLINSIGGDIWNTWRSIPLDDPNPASYFTPDVINNALTKEEDNRRVRNVNTVNQTFAPGFDRSYVPDTLDDAYINEILSGQREDANRSLDLAKARGKLNDVGYSGATAKLGTQESAARSTLDSLGNSVLAKNRAALGDVRSKALSGANSYSLGGPEFSLQPYQDELNTLLAGQQGSLKGDITNALGGTQLFNVNDILLAGSRQQGPQNLTTTNVPGIIPKKNPNQDRGLGSTGRF